MAVHNRRTVDLNPKDLGDGRGRGWLRRRAQFKRPYNLGFVIQGVVRHEAHLIGFGDLRVQRKSSTETGEPRHRNGWELVSYIVAGEAELHLTQRQISEKHSDIAHADR